MVRRPAEDIQERGQETATAPEIGACVLGMVRLVRDGRDVPLTPSERALVAGLTVAEHRVVTVDALAEWIWGGRSHASPRNRVQAVVSGIRRKVAPTALIVTHEAGYRLDDGVWTDVGHRASLTRRALGLDAASTEKHALLHEAEALDLGAALGGVADSPDVEARRRRIDEESLEVTLQRIESDLETGHLDGVASALGHLSESHPFHEQVHALLMRALVRVGRQAEALTVYRDVHTRLDEDLGVRPGPILAAAHHEVLTFDSPATSHTAAGDGTRDSTAAPAPAAADPADAADTDAATGTSTNASTTAGTGTPISLRQIPAPRTAPRSVAHLVGRESELERLVAAATRPTGTAPVVAVTGLGGMGKTTLAVEAAHRLRDDFPDGTLYLHLDSETGRAGVSSVLAHFLQLLGVPADVLPTSHDARVAMYRSILDTKRLLVVLDDIGPGVDVRDLLPTRAPSAAILTSRLPLTECEPTLRIVVTALGDQESVHLLGGLVGDDRVEGEADGLRQLAQACLGLPLLLRITAQRVASRPDLTLRRAASSLSSEIRGQSDGEQSDRAIYAGLGLAEAPLGDAAREVLGRFAGLPFRAASRWLLASLVADSPDADGDAAVDELHAAYLLETESREGVSTQFVLHDLVRLYAVQSEPHADVAEDLGRVARTLLVTALPQAQAYPVQFLPLPPCPDGRRLTRTSGPVDCEEALAFFRTEQDTFLLCAREVAATDAATAWRLLVVLGQHAQNGLELERWFAVAETVRGHLDADLVDDRRGLAHLDLVEAHLRHESAHSRLAATLATHARRTMLLDGDVDGAVVAAVVLGRAHRANGERAAAEEALEWASRSSDEDVDGIVRAYVALAWGSLLDDYDVLEAGREQLFEATRLFRDVEDWSGSATALFALARIHRRLGEYAAGLPLCDAAMDLFTRLGDVNGLTAVLDTRADILVQMGEPLQALPGAVQAVEQAAVRHDDFMLHRAQRTLGRAHAALGRLVESESVLRDSIAGFERLDRPLSRAASLRDLGRVLQLQGRLGEAIEVLESERDCLVRSGLTDNAELDGILARLDAKVRAQGGRPGREAHRGRGGPGVA
ncbi:BTAD domain-containing putative transcriptional regulator [Knoellia sp. LjRoot47]|uniref:AfsR/SARP family transcriptional regulator n=1 Tax=Knoellia sp. LjRoot47 TaxID=3342330 RepID=UPI003ECEB176